MGGGRRPSRRRRVSPLPARARVTRTSPPPSHPPIAMSSAMPNALRQSAKKRARVADAPLPSTAAAVKPVVQLTVAFHAPASPRTRSLPSKRHSFCKGHEVPREKSALGRAMRCTRQHALAQGQGGAVVAGGTRGPLSIQRQNLPDTSADPFSRSWGALAAGRGSDPHYCCLPNFGRTRRCQEE